MILDIFGIHSEINTVPVSDYPYVLIRPGSNKAVIFLNAIPLDQTAYDVYGNMYRFQDGGILYVKSRDLEKDAILTGCSIVPRECADRF